MNMCRLTALFTAIVMLSSAGLAFAGLGEFDTLIAKKGPKVKEVLYKPTLYRVAELPGLPVGRDAYEFLLDRPNLSLALARLVDGRMDKYKVEVRPDGSARVHDRDVLVGDMDVVSRTPSQRIYYISGYWDFMLGIRFNGRMVLVSDYTERPGSGGRQVDSRTRGYIRVDNALVGIIARMIVYIFPGKVDARIARFAGAVRKVAEAVHGDPAGVYRKLAAAGEVPQSDLREYREFFLHDMAESL